MATPDFITKAVPTTSKTNGKKFPELLLFMREQD
jgi:hypothetical protein